MHLRLDDHWVEYLRRLPESGMGYQLVDVRLRDGRRFDSVPVYNSEEMVLPGSAAVGQGDIEQIRLHDRG